MNTKKQLILLELMERKKQKAFLRTFARLYARDRARAEQFSLRHARTLVCEQLAQLLPAGFKTPGHYFRNIVRLGGAPIVVGEIWYWINSKTRSFCLCYIIVHPRYRRKGYATEALSAAELHARAERCNHAFLSVFPWNGKAIELYRKVGYSPAHLQLVKRLK